LLHSHGFSMALIEIDGLPFLKMGGFSMAMLNNQMVDLNITCLGHTIYKFYKSCLDSQLSISMSAVCWYCCCYDYCCATMATHATWSTRPTIPTGAIAVMQRYQCLLYTTQVISAILGSKVLAPLSGIHWLLWLVGPWRWFQQMLFLHLLASNLKTSPFPSISIQKTMNFNELERP